MGCGGYRTVKPFEGMGWFDTNVDQLKIYYDGDFEPLAGGLSPDDLHNLALLQGLIDKTADLELRSEREWVAATDAALLVTAGRPTGPSLPNETYVTTFTYTSTNIAERYLVLRVPHAANISHYRLLFTKLDGTEHALDGNHFSHLYTQSPYKYFGRSYTSNAVGDVLTIEAIELEKETTAYIGNVEGAYPVPDIEKLTDDMQVRSEAPTWSAGANHVDIGTFQGVPTLAMLEQHVYADQLDFVLASTENFAVIRVNNTNAIPQEVNAYRMVFTDTLDNSFEYIRGAYFRFLHHGLLHSYYGREVAPFDGLRLTLESSSIHGSTTLYQGNTDAAKVELPRGIFFNLLGDTERSVQQALEILDETDAGRIRVTTT